jgi:hypothetical protein
MHPRALALWLVALLVSVWPLAAWHELTTTHAVCAEHGEVLDVAHGGEGELEDGRPRLVDLDFDEHDPCAFAPLAQPAGGPGGAPLPRCEAQPLCSAAARPEVPRAPAFPRYLLAPKQSPPGGISS